MRSLDDLVPPDILRLAACRESDPEIFFDLATFPRWLGEYAPYEPGRLARLNAVRREEAKKICRRCPVIEECLDHYIGEQVGVFGGMDEDDRRRARNRRRRAAGKVQV